MLKLIPEVFSLKHFFVVYMRGFSMIGGTRNFTFAACVTEYIMITEISTNVQICASVVKVLTYVYIAIINTSTYTLSCVRLQREGDHAYICIATQRYRSDIPYIWIHIHKCWFF